MRVCFVRSARRLARCLVDSPELTYHTDEDASAILDRLLRDRAFRSDRLAWCRERAGLFTKEAYMENQHRILDAILATTTR